MKLFKVLMLLLVLALFLGCSDDDNDDPGFTLNIGTFESDENVDGRDFGVYRWNIAMLFGGTYDTEDIMEDMVIVVPYDEEMSNLIFADEATVELTIRDSTYFSQPLSGSDAGDYEETFLFFILDDFSNSEETYTIKYTHNDEEKNYSITIPYVNYLTDVSVTDLLENGPVMTFDWELEHSNSYQLLSAQQTGDEYENAFFSQKLKKSIREFSFPAEYNFDPAYNNYYSLTEVKQTQNSDLIGICAIIYAINVDENGSDKKKSYDAKELQLLAMKQFELLNKAILQNIKLNN